jgi:hypothetical protein
MELKELSIQELILEAIQNPHRPNSVKFWHSVAHFDKAGFDPVKNAGY